jgi:hypothetical protein
VAALPRTRGSLKSLAGDSVTVAGIATLGARLLVNMRTKSLVNVMKLASASLRTTSTD